MPRCTSLAAFFIRSTDREPRVSTTYSVIDTSRDWFTQYHLGQNSRPQGSGHGCNKLRVQGSTTHCSPFTETPQAPNMQFVPRCWHLKTERRPSRCIMCATHAT